MIPPVVRGLPSTSDTGVANGPGALYSIPREPRLCSTWQRACPCAARSALNNTWIATGLHAPPFACSYLYPAACRTGFLSQQHLKPPCNTHFHTSPKRHGISSPRNMPLTDQYRPPAHKSISRGAHIKRLWRFYGRQNAQRIHSFLTNTPAYYRYDVLCTVPRLGTREQTGVTGTACLFLLLFAGRRGSTGRERADAAARATTWEEADDRRRGGGYFWRWLPFRYVRAILTATLFALLPDNAATSLPATNQRPLPALRTFCLTAKRRLNTTARLASSTYMWTRDKL